MHRKLVERLDHVPPLVDRAIAQAVRRVLRGEAVPAQAKLLSRFEPHTQVIVRHQAGKAVEFGRKVWLDEVDGGIVSGYMILPHAGGQDQPSLAASLAGHRERFGRPPSLLAGDRGVASPKNERLAREAGVTRVVLPAVGTASPARLRQERQRWFRRGSHFRAGIEGRIHVLRRDVGLARGRDHGEAGLGRWVGWGMLTHNLATIAHGGAPIDPAPGQGGLKARGRAS